MTRHEQNIFAGQPPRRRGAILITTIGIIIVLTGLVLVFAQDMRTAAQQSANRLSYEEADAVEQGAEQWVLGQVEEYQTDAVAIESVPAAGLQVGSGYFWVLSPDPTQDQNWNFGIVDEAGKLNLNSATADEIMELPQPQTSDVADAVVDWRNTPTKASSDGAETDYYESLPEPYDCKNAPYETVEEVLLVRGITPQWLYGFDLNHDGVIEASESTVAGQVSTLTTSDQDSRGVFNYVTVFSVQPAGGTRTKTGLININTAPMQVLMCLPGLQQSDAENLVATRQGMDTTSTSWARQVIPGSYVQIASLITGISYQYSADIVAVSGDGRAFKRERIVVDCQQIPAKIVYRKDLTALGWPLPPDVRPALKAGKPVPSDAGGTGM